MLSTLSSAYDTVADSMPTSTQNLSRQPPGSACIQCRNKKMKCDARQPRCSTCISAGVECIRSSHQMKRGPKRDHIKSLENRIDTLEQELREARNNSMPDFSNIDLPLDSFDLLAEFNYPTDNIQTTLSDDVITDILCTDLDELYFERAYYVAPILHRHQYFSWARSETKTEAQVCLQYAMWTLAASLSSQPQHIRESLYQHTDRLVEALAFKNEASPCIEMVQSSLLMVIYDLMKISFHRGWIRAGRCFRLIQFMRLYEVDGPRRTIGEDDWIRQEEKRRAFWMAYSLDIFMSAYGEWPLTLHEHTDCIRLPAPENNFQSNHCIKMPYLSLGLDTTDLNVFSPFTESIIFATIFKHAMAHHRGALVNIDRSNDLKDFWNEHNSLSEVLKMRLKTLSVKCQSFHSSHFNDLILLFTMMNAHMTVLYLYETLQLIHQKTGEGQKALIASKYESLVAAQEIYSLSRSILPLGFLKVYPFTPLILAKCVAFLNSHNDLDERSQTQAQQIYELLKDMSRVNNIAQKYLISE